MPLNIAAKQVRIVDMLGRTVIKLNEGFNYIPTSDWTPRMYILQYTDKSGKPVSRRLIKR
ncbi:MAG: T9SS type A sorting domain-containing protein [Bacteroidetes bacterium]|nr:T9SS type A sorting domain-containing protein [Bacteroidota bacterium]